MGDEIENKVSRNITNTTILYVYIFSLLHLLFWEHTHILLMFHGMQYLLPF